MIILIKKINFLVILVDHKFLITEAIHNQVGDLKQREDLVDFKKTNLMLFLRKLNK
jgi:hypothetical protein